MIVRDMFHHQNRSTAVGLRVVAGGPTDNDDDRLHSQRLRFKTEQRQSTLSMILPDRMLH